MKARLTSSHIASPAHSQSTRFKRALLAAVVISSAGLSVSSWAADTTIASASSPAVSAPQADRDGRRPEWTPEQRAQFKAKHEQARVARQTEFFQQLDKNKDGQVTLAEWLAFQPEHHPRGGEGHFGGPRDDAPPPPAGEFHPLANTPDGQQGAADTPDARRAKHEAEWWQRVDSNHDNLISKAEAEANAPRLAEHFNEVDSNHDGLISAQELQAFHAAQQQKWHDRIEQHRTKTFEQADTNHDGKLTLQEWLAYKPHHPGFWQRLWHGLVGHHDRRDEGREGRPHARDGHWFKHVDSNGDGQISLSEAQANAPRLAAHFNEIDTDHNGQISQDELHAFFGARDGKPQS